MKDFIPYIINQMLAGLVLLVLITALTLSGCSGGDDGATGPAGPAGATGPAGPAGPAIGAAPSVITENMNATIDAATVAADGTLSISFTVVDDGGYGFHGLPNNRIRFTLVQLIPAGARGPGESTQWQSYINKVETAPTDPAKGPGTTDAVQATYENNGTFVDNGDGSYNYTYNVNLMNVTSPVAVPYNADYTHRVAFQISGGGFPTMNETYDWQPSTGFTTGITNRKMVREETCNSCHGELAMHGGGRVDTDYCVTCHNPGTTDANTGNVVDFKVMVHKIHRGAHLPSVVAGGVYNIFGYKDGEHDYSDTELPMDIRNCTACHDETIAETPDAANWHNAPTMEACGSCHDDIDFSLGQDGGHVGGVQPNNAECAICHKTDGLADVETYHTAVVSAFANVKTAVVVEPKTARINQATGDVEVDVMITLDGAPVTALHDDAGVDTAQGAQLGKYEHGTDNGALAINWDNGEGFQINHQEIVLNDCVPDGTGLFTCSKAGMLAGIADGDVITTTAVDVLVCMDDRPNLASTGDIAACEPLDSNGENPNQVAVTPTIVNFEVDSNTADGTVITTNAYDKIGADLTACQTCHRDDKFHHGATKLTQCKTCHNATRTGFRGIGDLKRHVHRFHMGLDQNGLSDGNQEQSDHFPNDIGNCKACHSDGQFDVPVQQNHRASAATGTNGTVYISPTAVVCSSCHIVDVANLGQIDPSVHGYVAANNISLDQQAIIDHMISNGAVFGSADFDAANKVESCAVCHAIGAEFGVDKVHNIK